jgi:hypothetical protein
MLDRLHREKLPLTYEERRRVSARLAQRGLDALDMGAIAWLRIISPPQTG